MGEVLLALIPATLFGLWLFGWLALNLLLVTVASALAAEALALRIAGRALAPDLFDGSAMLTALLLALSLPPWAPWWIGALGGLFAVVLGKQIFGGIGQNPFNPAMLARVVLLISFPVELTFWVPPHPMGTAGAPGFLESLGITFAGVANLDAVSGATVLGYVKTELGRGTELANALTGHFDFANASLGMMGGSLGETSALLIFAGGVYLLARKIISWHIPVAFLLALAVPAELMHLINPARFGDAVYHVLTGGAMLGAFFIATDYVTSPSTKPGQLIFGAGCGLLVWVIRSFGGYPEGVAFAVLLMNATTPLIDHWVRPRIYGRDKKGESLKLAGEKK
jgi:electron transport complex protein RnfD